MNSRDKGKRGELDLAAWLRELGYETARRGQQRAGGSDSPDVIAIPGVHIEAKRSETFSPYRAFAQAVYDSAGTAEPVVFHRYSRGRWMAFMDGAVAARLLKFISFVEGSEHEQLKFPNIRGNAGKRGKGVARRVHRGQASHRRAGLRDGAQDN